MPNLLETLAAELERPRDLTPQVIKHIIGTYEIEQEGIGEFLLNKLPTLEEYEHDLILSALFTPKLAHQAVFAELLGSRSIPKNEWPELIQKLEMRSTQAQLITSDGKKYSVRLRAVSIERFVHRLRLDGTIQDSILKLIDRTPAADRPLLKAVARRAIWEQDGRREILARYLWKSLADGTYALRDAVEVLRLAEDYQPADPPALLARIPRWIGLLEEEINSASGSKPFFSRAVQEMHGGNDQRQLDETRTLAKKNELAFLLRLQLLIAD